jgi:hypothetical protein
VVVDIRYILVTSSALLGVWLQVPHAAQAQSMSISDRFQVLERQTELLQKELKELKEEKVTRAKTVKKKGEEVATRTAEQVDKKASDEDDTQKSKQADQKTNEENTILAYAKDPINKFIKAVPEKVTVTLGGFIAAETV